MGALVFVQWAAPGSIGVINNADGPVTSRIKYRPQFHHPADQASKNSASP